MDYRLTNGKMLRCGYTTGSCAAAAAKAAAIMLLSQTVCGSVVLETPKGTVLRLDVLDQEFSATHASCAVQKDSGDDPDITNGALVYAYLTKIREGVAIVGGKGVGRVLKPGLDQPVGEYAINTVPRRMIINECGKVGREYGYEGGFSVAISVPGGEELAKRTFNAHLGIEGGLSILGTTGIVEPMSEAAIIGTIRAELNVLRRAGHKDILLTIGNYGEAFARERLGLSTASCVKCSNYIGEAMSAAAEAGFSRALLVGHIGKLVKLGIGLTNTHSANGDGRIETLITCALDALAPYPLLLRLRQCVTTDSAVALLEEEGLLDKTMALLARRIEHTIERHVAAHMATGFICFRGMGEMAGICAQSENANDLLGGMRL